MAKTVEKREAEEAMVPKRPLDDILDEVLSEPKIALALNTADILRDLRGPLPYTDADRR